jgi:hypothetical protein
MVNSSPWAIQVLTLDYLIDGVINPNIATNLSFLQVSFTSTPSGSLSLKSTMVQPTGSAEAPTGNISRWLVSFKPGLIGVIPRSEPGRAYVLKHTGGDYPCAAELRIGPYAIRGTLLSPYKPRDIANITGDLSFAMQDVEIDCVSADGKLKGLKASVMVLCTHLLQGILLRD